MFVLAKLRIGEAHSLATGDRVLVAVIDSGIDFSHPELAGVIVGSYDALGKAEKPHQHRSSVLHAGMSLLTAASRATGLTRTLASNICYALSAPDRG